MIPKVIHYCWFGNKPLTDKAKKCIESWKKYCPDFKIKKWNETNFNLNCCEYVKEASERGKWAFVSDYARFWIIYNYGGMYFDTDVELIKPIKRIFSNGPFMGCETNKTVNPGLGMAAPAGLAIYKEVLDYYSGQHFLNADGSENDETIVTKVTRILKNNSFLGLNKVEQVGDITIYPKEYLCPLNYETGKLNITDKTVAIHHYDASWHSKLDDIIILLERNRNSKNYRLRRLVSLPLRVINKIRKKGIAAAIVLTKKKVGDLFEKQK